MATVAELLVKIGGDSSGLQKEIAASQRQLKRAFGSGGLELSGTASGLLAMLGAAMVAAGAAAVKMSADFTASKTAFTTLLGSADKAEQMLNNLATFAADTPFELPGLIKSTQKLLAFQFAGEDVIPIMAAVGNAISLVGGGQEAIDGVVRALGQIQAKGKLSAEEMNQLAERGINGWKYLADSMGLSIAQVMDLCQNGAIDSTTAINAIVLGMQNNFKGGMDAMSKTVPGLLSTIKDNVGIVMRQIGDQITSALNLQGVLQNVADFLTQFSSAVKSVGIKEALQGLIPPEVTGAVFVLAGAIIGAAVPAMVAFALSAWAAIAPLLPFIAIGAAVGALAYEIWNNWEPLSELFSVLWDTITQLFSDYLGIITGIINSCFGWAFEYISSGWNSVCEVTGSVWSGIANFIGNAWQSIKQIVAEGITWIIEKMQPLLDLVGSILPAGVKNLFNNLSAGIGKVATVASKLHLGGIDISGKIPESPKPNTTFTGLHGTAPAGANTKSNNETDKEAREAEKAWEELQRKAEQVSNAIEKEWVQTTKTQLEQLDIWRDEEITKLDETKDANENYERDKERVAAVYSARRTKIVQQEAKDAIDTFQSIRDSYLSFQKDIKLGNLTGSVKDITSKGFDLGEKQKNIKDTFDKIAQEYNTGTDQHKKNILNTLDQLNIAYEKSADDKLNFDKTTSQISAEYQKQYMREVTDYYATCKDIQADIDAAYNANSMAMLQQALTEQNAIRMNDYNAQKSMMDTWQAAFLAAHSTTAQLVSSLYAGAFSGLQTCFSDLLSGAKSLGDSIEDLGNSLLKVIDDYIAKWLAGRLMMSIFGKTTMAAETATNIAAGATTATAWAPAAAMVSLATFGENSGPAMAGIGATTALTTALALPKLASGGITTGPTLAEIGEGHYDEAVVPLNKKAFEKAGLTGNGEGGVTHIHQYDIKAWDRRSVAKWLENEGGRMFEQYTVKRAREFAPVEG